MTATGHESRGPAGPEERQDASAGSADSGDPGDGNHRAGFCALVGLPNVGKSTLLNGLVEERLAIVTPKPQTTRRRLLGIHSATEGQIVFVDTPGLLEPRYALQEAMLDEAERAAEDADLVVYVVDAGYPPSVEAARRFRESRDAKAVLCLNKVDRVSAAEHDSLEKSLRKAGWEDIVPTVASQGKGVRELRRTILRRLPDSPPLYPRDQLAVATMREFAAEFVRESCFEVLAQEVPYSVAVEVEQFREEEDPIYIGATIFVERPSQKGIVIGEGGRTIRRIGTSARRKIEGLVGRKVYLDLWVKVLRKWRKNKEKLERLGFHVPA